MRRNVCVSIAVGILCLGPLAASAAAPEALAPGAQLLESRRFEEARKFFAAYAAKNPKDADGALYLGRAYLGLRKTEDAVQWLEKAVELAPGSSEKHQRLGEAYGMSARDAGIFSAPGFAHKAKTELEKAVALDPANLDARTGLFQFALQAPGFMGGSVEDARQQAAEIRKRDALRGHQAMAQILLHEKDPAGAEKELRQAIQEAPAEPRAKLNLGLFYVTTERWNEAFDVFEGMLKADPQGFNALYQIGRTGGMSGQRLPRAEECLRRYLGHTPGAQDPPLANAHYRLGTVLEKKGDKAGARTEYQAAIRLDPHLEDAKKALAKLS